MDVIFDWNMGNMIYNGLITLRCCGFPFAEIRVASGISLLGEVNLVCDLVDNQRSCGAKIAGFKLLI